MQGRGWCTPLMPELSAAGAGTQEPWLIAPLCNKPRFKQLEVAFTEQVRFAVLLQLSPSLLWGSRGGEQGAPPALKGSLFLLPPGPRIYIGHFAKHKTSFLALHKDEEP